MESGRQEAIRRQVLQSIEDQAEALSFQARICNKVGDEKGMEAIKKQLEDLTKKIDAANAILSEKEN